MWYISVLNDSLLNSLEKCKTTWCTVFRESKHKRQVRIYSCIYYTHNCAINYLLFNIISFQQSYMFGNCLLVKPCMLGKFPSHKTETITF